MSAKAIIKLAGKQFYVSEGDLVKVDKHLDNTVGSTITVDEVLLTVDGAKTQVGKPLVKDAQVSLEILTLKKSPKVTTARYTAKSRHRRTVGHRQPITELRVTKIK